MKPFFVGWLLDPRDRAKLLTQVPPRYPDVVAHHVTLAVGTKARRPPPSALAGEIVGRADDDAGVEALVVRIDGTTSRPGGGTYHVTWSLDRARGRRPADSNDVLARCGWTKLGPVKVRLLPTNSLEARQPASADQVPAGQG
jgi:hypothetical protein